MKSKSVDHDIPDNGNRVATLTEFADGTATCKFTATDTTGKDHSATFSGAAIVAAFVANAPHLDAWKAANPSITTAQQLADHMLSVRELLKAHGDFATGFS